MGAASRRDSTPLREELYEHPARFEFFQAVRLLRKLARSRRGIAAGDPGEEFVRFRSAVSLAFPAADIEEITPPEEAGEAAVMTVAFMGAASPASFGSLPTHYAVQLLEEEREKNLAPRDFLDLFNHRILSLFFQSWEKYRLDIQHEGDRKIYESALFSLLGLGTSGLADRMLLKDRALLSRGGLLARTPMPATCLAALLKSYFRVPVEIVQFCATLYRLEADELHRLGRVNSTLGQDAIIGQRVRLSQFKFIVRLGPLGWDDYQDFFPDAAGFGALDGLVRLGVSAEFDFDSNLVLRADEVPPLRLERDPSQACRLGWSTWLPRPSDSGDADEAVLRHPDVPLAPNPRMN